MYFFSLLFGNLLFINADQGFNKQHCGKDEHFCGKVQGIPLSTSDEERFLFYDIDPQEGFNLRLDVYMRLAIMLAQAQNKNTAKKWLLVLPPWHQFHHWNSQGLDVQPKPWSTYFDVTSLKSYAPVIELFEVFPKLPTKTKFFEIEVLYILQNYEDPMQGGTYANKWEIIKQGCEYNGNFWGYKNITAKEVICARYQGQIGMLWDLITLTPLAKTVMIANSQHLQHKSFDKSYEDCRKSMKFSSDLESEADTYLRNHLNCRTRGCPTYVSVHWRRQDFTVERRDDIPSVNGTATQIHEFITELCPKVNKIYIASDATELELVPLKRLLVKLGYIVYQYTPSEAVLEKYLKGGIAIIDQIICSRAAYFIGTRLSTFSRRIIEERQLLGFDPRTTYNEFCSDSKDCLKMSRWPSMQRADVKQEFDCVCYY